MSSESYNPDEFRRCCMLRGLARAPVVDRYISQQAKLVYHEDDFIAVHRLDEARRDGIAHSNPLSPARMARTEEKAKRLG
jgi:hypothetical protein